MIKKLLGLFLIVLLVFGAIYISSDVSYQLKKISFQKEHYDKVYAKEMFDAINDARKNEGLHEYVWYDVLEEAADIRAIEISRKMSHDRPDGTPFYTVHEDAHGENIAKGFPTVEKVMIGFMESEGHRAAILSPDYYYVTCSVYYAEGVYYFVQLFR